MATLLRLAALAATLLVVVGFAAFAIDEAGRGSHTQVERLGNELEAAPPSSAQRQRRSEHGPVRGALDRADAFLLGPFEGVTASRNVWMQRAVPSVLALLVYGLGLLLLANYLPKPRRAGNDWRTA